jgi:hypothetical protein
MELQSDEVKVSSIARSRFPVSGWSYFVGCRAGKAYIGGFAPVDVPSRGSTP